MILNSKAPGFILGLFLFCLPVYAAMDGKFHIAVIDTGFCNKSPLVRRPIDLTKSVVLNCNSIDKKNRRFHGHFVLEKFLSHNKRKDITITPLIVFDKDGVQKEQYWKNAINWIKKNKVDLIMTASGLKTEKSIGTLPALTFAASGQVSGKLRRFHKIWPQSFPSQKLVLIGNLLKEDGNIYYADNLLLHQSRIDYFVEEDSSSKAVATALAKVLNRCKSGPTRDCIKGKSHKITDQVTKKTLEVL